MYNIVLLSTEVICDVASATSIEVRAKFNDYQRRKIYGDHKGISCFSPVINIMRHPLWGRNQVRRKSLYS